MSVPIKSVLGILADNLEKRKSVVPLSPKKAAVWAQGLDIPFGGETIIYTGHMYQITPSINSMAGWLAKFENSWITRFFGIGRVLNKRLNLSWFMMHNTHGEQETYNGVLRNIACLLKAVGVKFGYLYEQELYSGALLFDEGVDDVFTEQAHRVYQILKDNGVKRVIAMDPHTTDMLRNIYPKTIDGYKLEVKSYLEVLAEHELHPVKHLDLDLVIHDSCLYARYENMIDEPRKLLKDAGIKIHEPELSGKLTHCCGGPLESLFPSKSNAIATNRIDQLTICGNRLVTMCPICLANLKRAAGTSIDIRDISEYLADAYCPKTT